MNPQLLQMIMARLHGGGPGGPQGAPPDAGPPGGGYDSGPPQGPSDKPQQAGAPDPLGATKAVIQDMHSLIAVLPDPEHTQIATKAMAMVMQIQKDLMGTHQTASAQGVNA